MVGNRGVEEVVDLAKLVLLGGMEFPFFWGQADILQELPF